MPECLYSGSEVSGIINQLLATADNSNYTLREFLEYFIRGTLSSQMSTSTSNILSAIGGISSNLSGVSWKSTLLSVLQQIQSFRYMYDQMVFNSYIFDPGKQFPSIEGDLYYNFSLEITAYNVINSTPTVVFTSSFSESSENEYSLRNEFTTIVMQLGSGYCKLEGYIYVPFASSMTNEEKKDLFTILVKNNGQSSLNSHLLLSQIQKNMSPSWADWIVQKSSPTEGDMTIFDGSISSLPSIINLGVTTLALFQGVVNNAFNWLDLLFDLLNALYESIVAYQENNKLDRILECEFDFKKFNRLLGDALNYAMKDAGIADPNHTEEYMFPVVSRNDQQYLDLNPDGQACLDWDGGLPALVNHRQYNFKKVWCVGELQTDPIPYKVYIIPNWIQDVPQMCAPADHPDLI